MPVLQVRITEEDMEALEYYSKRHGLDNRSAAIRRMIRAGASIQKALEEETPWQNEEK